MKDALKFLSIIVGTISVVSFTQRLFDIGLLEVARVLIDYYRNIAHMIFAVPLELIHIKIPPTLIDIWTISFVGASAYVSVPNIENSRFFQAVPSLTSYKNWKVVFLFAMGFSGFGIAVLISSISPNTYVDEFHEEPLDLMKGAARRALYIFGGTLVFFILNAFAPSV